DARNVLQREERRRAPAEVERLDRLPTAELPPVRLDLRLQRADERARVAPRRHEVEVAVRAALDAEGDVDVEASQGNAGAAVVILRERSERRIYARGATELVGARSF